MASVFVIIKKGENVICSFDDLTNLGTLYWYQFLNRMLQGSCLSIVDETNPGT